MTSKYDTDDFELKFTVTVQRITPLIECPRCDGNGEVHTKYHNFVRNRSCNRCFGTGQIYENTNASSPTIPQALIDDLKIAWNIHNDFIKECPDCNGEGEWDDAAPGDISFNTFKCKKCDGSGTVYENPSNI